MKNKLKIMSIFCFVFACCFSILLTGCSKSEPKIQIESQFKTNYYVGESLDVLGGILKYTDANEKESFVEITPEMISSFTTHTHQANILWL